MYYAVVHYLENYPVEIDHFRKKYDPRFQVVNPHVTFVFPIHEEINQENLIEHIQSTLRKVKPFQISFSGISRSWDDMVFLLVKEGSENVVKLHDQLYTGLLEKFLRKDIDYTPHVTLGKVFRNDSIIKEAEDLKLEFSTIVRELTLIKRENEMGEIVFKKDFDLG